MISAGVFFSCSKFWFFGLLGGWKGKKWAKMTKKFCLSRSISQEPYIIWLSFMVQMCKMIIFPAVFFIFYKFWFFRLLGGWKGKKWPLSVAPYLIITVTYYGHLIFIYGTYVCTKRLYLQAFFKFFSKFWYLESLGGR